MTQKDQIIEAIYAAIDEVNLQLQASEKIEKSMHVILFDDAGKLSSLGLINLIVELEQKIEEHFHVIINLLDEKSLEESGNPFKTISNLAEYADHLLEKKNKAI